jgi:uncharacterized membrane protein
MKEPKNNLEARMRKISLITSLFSLGLMIFGFVDVLIHGASLSLPGVAALSPLMLKAGRPIPLGLAAMSAGIVLLSLLPILRVLLALSLYVRNRQVMNVIVALVVFVELLASARMGG